ncbi:hypothetical protein CEXT_394921 [Caerostris extrusa]|uniref:Uncharacterized protein n=1 Tax=Caerostris extrusa TaxID=172846 RepID=A0AAV4VGL7_CAEEX|nr:hypothetical protein CEXT_394921 [Caerostris extrusa]
MEIQSPTSSKPSFAKLGRRKKTLKEKEKKSYISKSGFLAIYARRYNALLQALPACEKQRRQLGAKGEQPLCNGCALCYRLKDNLAEGPLSMFFGR